MRSFLILIFTFALGCSTTRVVYLRNEPLGDTLTESKSKEKQSEKKQLIAAVAMSSDKKSVIFPVYNVESTMHLRKYKMQSKRVSDQFCYPSYRFDDNCEKSLGKSIFWDWILGPASLWLIPYFSAEEKKADKYLYAEEKRPIIFITREGMTSIKNGEVSSFDGKPKISVCKEDDFSKAITSFREGVEPPYGVEVVKKLLQADYNFTEPEIASMEKFLFADYIKEPLLGATNISIAKGNQSLFKVKESEVLPFVKAEEVSSEKFPVVVQRLWDGQVEDIISPEEMPAEEPVKKIEVPEEEDNTPELIAEATGKKKKKKVAKGEKRPNFAQSVRFPFFSDLPRSSLHLCTALNEEELDSLIDTYNVEAQKNNSQIVTRSDLELVIEPYKKKGPQFFKADLSRLSPFLKQLKTDLLIDFGPSGRVKFSPQAL